MNFTYAFTVITVTTFFILGCTSELNNPNPQGIDNSQLTYSYVGERAISDISPVNANTNSLTFCEYRNMLCLAYINQTSGISVYCYDGTSWEKLGDNNLSTGTVTSYEFNELSMITINDELFIGFSEFDATGSSRINYVVKKFNGNQWEGVGGVITSIEDFIMMIAAKITSHNNELYIAYSHQTPNLDNNVCKVKKLENNTWEEISPENFSEVHAVDLDFTFHDDIPVVAHSYGFFGIGIVTLSGTGWHNENNGIDAIGYSLSLMADSGDLYFSFSNYMQNDENENLQSYGRIDGTWQKIDISSPTGVVVRTLLFSHDTLNYLAYIHGDSTESLISLSVLENGTYKPLFEEKFPVKPHCYNHALFYSNSSLYAGFYDFENNYQISVARITGF